MNVYDYATATGVWYRDPTDTEDVQESLKSMPIDSPCGQDCKKAIDAAVPLIQVIRQAYGNESMEQDAITSITLDAVCVFICG